MMREKNDVTKKMRKNLVTQKCYVSFREVQILQGPNLVTTKNITRMKVPVTSASLKVLFSQNK